MKHLTILIAFVTLLFNTGCKKCYRCESNRRMTVCQYSKYYDAIQNDTLIINGTVFTCK